MLQKCLKKSIFSFTFPCQEVFRLSEWLLSNSNWICSEDNSAIPTQGTGIVIWDAITLFYLFLIPFKTYFHDFILETLPFFVIRYKNTYKKHLLSLCRTHILSPIVPIQKITSCPSSVLSWPLGYSALFWLDFIGTIIKFFSQLIKVIIHMEGKWLRMR